MSSIARNSRGIYYLERSYDKTGTYSSYQSANVYFLGTSSNSWVHLHTICSNSSTESRPSWNALGLMSDPNGDIQVLHIYSGWYSYGHKARSRIISSSDHSLGGWVDVAMRGAGHPDISRNRSFAGKLYLDSLSRVTGYLFNP